LVNVFLFLFSTFIALFAAELILRAMIFSEKEDFRFLKDASNFAIYPDDGNEPFFNEDYWKLNYAFNPTFNLEDPNPLLGWTGFFDRKTYAHWHVDNTGTKRPVLLYGDSFAMCIDSTDCFEDFLNSDSTFSLNNHLYNYGVGGYGLDQIYLLFKETVSMYKKPFVIFSVLTTDLDRSVLRVRDAQKPYFELSGDSLVLKGIPITLSSKEYFDHNPPEIHSYLYNWIYNKGLKKFLNREGERLTHINHIKEINGKILDKAFRRLKELNTEFVVLIFQPAWQVPDWRLEFLKEKCSSNAIPFICDVDIRKQALDEQGIDPERLFIPGDGHPTSLANKLVSEELKKIVLDSLHRP
jgi:hypothetical protein